MPPAQNLSPSKALTFTILVALLAASTVRAAEPLQQPNGQGVAAGQLTVSPATMTFAPSPILSGSIGLSQAQQTEKANTGVRARGRDSDFSYVGRGLIVACLVTVVMITMAT